MEENYNSKSEMLVTIGIATFNRCDSLVALLRQLKSQNYNNFEIIIVDQSSESISAINQDNISKLNDDRIKYFQSNINNLPNARNVIISHALGEIVIFLDDDVILLSNEFVLGHALSFLDARVGGVTGRHIERYISPNSHKTICEVSIFGRPKFNLFGEDRVFVKSCKGSNMSFRRSVFLEVGGFDRKTNMFEDADFSYRLRKFGWKILYNPEVEVIHLSLPSGGVRESKFSNKEVRAAFSTGYFIFKHRGYIGVIFSFFYIFLRSIKLSIQNFNVNYLTSCLKNYFSGVKLAHLPADEKIG